MTRGGWLLGCLGLVGYVARCPRFIERNENSGLDLRVLCFDLIIGYLRQPIIIFFFLIRPIKFFFFLVKTRLCGFYGEVNT